ncbi:hypothetical protein MKA27_13180 [[Clostridium] innocuum]|uniref:hypothetical protein n=1 Tax=Clostridium innocuum TaxID=1522 RepID=UPI000D6D5FBC|nr:hypothetical protein [[Clostridium] innocuum]MCR0315261.1 hypothetical protein [[Clostridium] innocuum]MCR0369717.1 hypothetical protein [[Clostridium] innocuum]MCR0374772.1 hypothetical protein [[Clostridium] innocuum]MCR0559670.1 hypothetical protein [[Clostridium] innocuum]MCR0602636.1 hypothetical protein [[Clostridium] innocuum]
MADSKLFSNFRAKLDSYEDLITSNDTTSEMYYLTFGNRKAFHEISIIYGEDKDYIQDYISHKLIDYIMPYLSDFPNIKLFHKITDSNDILILIIYQNFTFTLDLFNKQLSATCPQLKLLLSEKNEISNMIQLNEEKIKKKIAKRNLENITDYKDYICFIVMKKRYIKKINADIKSLNERLENLKDELVIKDELIHDFKSKSAFKNSQKLLSMLNQAIIGLAYNDDLTKGGR